MDLPILDTSCKWNYIAYSLLWLPSLTPHSDFKIHPWCSTCRHGLPSCGSCSMAWVCHTWLIRLSVTVHFCTVTFVHFCPLWPWWLTLLWTFMYKVLGKHVYISFLRRRVAGSYGNFIFNVSKNYKLLSKMASPFQNLISNVWGLQFPHMLANNRYCHFYYYYYSLPSGCEMVSHWNFDSYLPNNRWWLACFLFLLISHLCVFFGDKST